jgi:hypothetical protein
MAANALRTSSTVAAGAAALTVAYAAVIERNAFVMREVTMPVLSPGSTPLRVLHLSDIHMRPAQRQKQAWLRELSRWEPDLVVNTGDNLSHPRAVPSVVQALGDLLAVPGVFVSAATTTSRPRSRTRPNTSATAITGRTETRCPGRTCARRSPSAAGWTSPTTVASSKWPDWSWLPPGSTIRTWAGTATTPSPGRPVRPPT